jgi:hypothetical protein
LESEETDLGEVMKMNDARDEEEVEGDASFLRGDLISLPPLRSPPPRRGEIRPMQLPARTSSRSLSANSSAEDVRA